MRDAIVPVALFLSAVSAVAPNLLLVRAQTSSAPAPHVMLIVEENREEGDVIGSAAAPYVNELAARYGFAENSYAQSHPSLPNYLELLSGSTWGVSDDGTGYQFNGSTFVDQLSSAGISWRAAMESMPSSCYGGASWDGYAKKHDPFMYFTSITTTTECSEVVPFGTLVSQVTGASAPSFIWVTPNLCNDGHDCSTATMDAWLSTQLPPVLSSAWFAADGIVIITWDEGVSDAGCCSGAGGGHVATVVISSRVHTHLVQTMALDHAGVLRTLEELYQQPLLRDAVCACSGDLMQLIGPAPAPVPTWLGGPHLR